MTRQHKQLHRRLLLYVVKLDLAKHHYYDQDSIVGQRIVLFREYHHHRLPTHHHHEEETDHLLHVGSLIKMIQHQLNHYRLYLML